MQSMLELFPFAKQTNDNIEKQNRFLQKISLTGKINALDFSENLFTYTDETIVKFSSLKEELIEALIEESTNKVLDELELKAQLSIDVLKRNLFERTADVGFLATDSEIIAFLQNQNYPKEQIVNRLNAYISKYSVYEDVLLFDTQGRLRANVKESHTLDKTQDSLIKKALESDDFIEVFKKSDITSDNNKSLLYAQKIQDKNKIIGVLILHFKFEDELSTIFQALVAEDEILFLEDDTGVIASNNKKVPIDSHITLTKYKNLLLYKNQNIAVQKETKGYQGYYGLPWKMTAVDINKSDEKEKTFPKQILPKKLKSIIDHAHEIVDDLGDVIINGELIASKYRQYTLSPILENLRLISSALLEDINNSAENLANTKTSALVASGKLSTLFCMDIMDRNLYERANDCRWWALTPFFIQELRSPSPDKKQLQQILKSINNLYTVYTDILLYDKDGIIISSSQDQSFVGTTIEGDVITKTLHNTNPQNYFVSPFKPTPYYHDRPTYIYHASIIDKGQNVGGIAVVFDSEIEFKAILEDSMPNNTRGFMIFCDKDAKVISSTNSDFPPLSSIKELPTPTLASETFMQEFISFNDTHYLLTIVPSKGYREYKNTDNYNNEVYTLSFIAL